MKIIVYAGELYAIGGIETAIFGFCKNMKKHHDILVLAEAGSDKDQLNRLRKNGVNAAIRERSLQKKYVCDVLIRFTVSGEPKNVVAKRQIQMIHADFSSKYLSAYSKACVPQLKKRPVTFVAVSKRSADGFSVVSDIKPKVIENFYPVQLKLQGTGNVNNSQLHLVTASRLSEEKGYAKMVTLAKRLKKAGINYRWHVYTRDCWKIDETLFIKHDPELNIASKIAAADWLVQLSDSEAFCYTVQESLAVGTPILINDWAGYDEFIDIKNDGLICNDPEKFDLSLLKKHRIDPHKNTNKNNKIAEKWNKLLESEVGDCQYVVAINQFNDLQCNSTTRKIGDVWAVSEQRYRQLAGAGLVKKGTEWTTIL